MNTDKRIYGQEFNLSVLKDLKKIDDEIEKEEDPEEIARLRLAKLYRGMELSSGNLTRNYRGFFPY